VVSWSAGDDFRAREEDFLFVYSLVGGRFPGGSARRGRLLPRRDDGIGGDHDHDDDIVEWMDINININIIDCMQYGDISAYTIHSYNFLLNIPYPMYSTVRPVLLLPLAASRSTLHGITRDPYAHPNSNSACFRVPGLNSGRDAAAGSSITSPVLTLATSRWFTIRPRTTRERTSLLARPPARSGSL
jgi:hypothetical protein